MCKVPAVHVAEKRVWTWWHKKNLSTSTYCSFTALFYCKTRCMTGSYCHIMRSLSLAISCSSCLLYHSPLFSWHQCPQQNNCADCGTGRQLTKEGNTHTRTNKHSHWQMHWRKAEWHPFVLFPLCSVLRTGSDKMMPLCADWQTHLHNHAWIPALAHSYIMPATVCVNVRVCKRYRARVSVHPPKLSISSCDLINNNTRDRAHDLHSAAACMHMYVVSDECVCVYILTVSSLSTNMQD